MSDYRTGAYGRSVKRSTFAADLTSFVGRERELAAVRDRLRAGRLVTITGPGGIGKTRLALRVAGVHPHAARVVELAHLDDSETTAAAVAGVAAREDLQGSASLLVLDNCEHVAPACAALVDELLASCPLLRVLATSRVPLGVDGEARVRLPPMTPEESARLFADRARLHRHDFVIDATNAADVERVCRQLDGIPLAIELAAARVSSLTTREIAARLDDGLALLTRRGGGAPGRHRSLRATLDWSYELLDTSERTMLRRLAVFAAGFTLDAAEHVCSGRGIDRARVVDLLSALIDHSLVQPQTTASVTRYRLLEAVRTYALERFSAPDSPDAVSDDVCLLFRLDGDYWTIGPPHAPWRLRDARGLRIMSTLLSNPGREIHVLDPVVSAGVDTGSAGDVLDAEARAAYRRRLAELTDEIEEARSWQDPHRLARAEEERDELAKYLSAAVGIGGRSRRASAASERARVAATRAVRLALTRIEARDASLGSYLRATVRTGTFLSYTPDPSRPVTFVVTP